MTVASSRKKLLSVTVQEPTDALNHPMSPCSKLYKQGDIGRFKASVGSYNVTDKSCLLEEATVTTADLTDNETSLSDESSIDSDEDTGTYPYFNNREERIQATLEADRYMASAAHASPRKSISADQLSKVWKIDRESTQRPLDVTSKHCKRNVNPDLSRNYPTGNRMLRYKRLKEFFFMDTFFVTRDTSSRIRAGGRTQNVATRAVNGLLPIRVLFMWF